MNVRILLSVTALILISAEIASAQMEKRKESLYQMDAFVNSSPKIGEHAPRITVRTLDGKPVTLDEYRGTNVVIVKGGYT